jgi:hypothetical protein
VKSCKKFEEILLMVILRAEAAAQPRKTCQNVIPDFQEFIQKFPRPSEVFFEFILLLSGRKKIQYHMKDL